MHSLIVSHYIKQREKQQSTTDTPVYGIFAQPQPQPRSLRGQYPLPRVQVCAALTSLTPPLQSRGTRAPVWGKRLLSHVNADWRCRDAACWALLRLALRTRAQEVRSGRAASARGLWLGLGRQGPARQCCLEPTLPGQGRQSLWLSAQRAASHHLWSPMLSLGRNTQGPRQEAADRMRPPSESLKRSFSGQQRSPDHGAEKSHSCSYQLDLIKLTVSPLDSSFRDFREF